MGHTFESFWRPNQLPVGVGDRVENGLHLLQLWTRGPSRHEEVLVLYRRWCCGHLQSRGD
jgi:hypothetical protein